VDSELVYSTSYVSEDALGVVISLPFKVRIRNLQYLLGDVDGYGAISCVDFKVLQRLSDRRLPIHESENLELKNNQPVCVQCRRGRQYSR
jgi:hypothetical protein